MNTHGIRNLTTGLFLIDDLTGKYLSFDSEEQGQESLDKNLQNPETFFRVEPLPEE